MLISGFTFIKNGLTLGYPIKESIQSIDSLVDEVIINVGFDDPGLGQDDGTYDYLRDHFQGPKYRFLKSYWDPKKTKDGLILSEQTNLALRECRGKYCQYIQGDEAIHEQDLKEIERGVTGLEKNPSKDGLVFNYFHFYGNVDIIKQTRNIYRREIRLIRNHQNIVSHLDAQGFRYSNGKKIPCLKTDAYIYHYGWAREDKVMAQKTKSMDKLYHGRDYENKTEFRYQREWGLRRFKGHHPRVMQDWIAQNKNPRDPLSMGLKLRAKDLRLIISDGLEYLTNYRIGEYKGFK